MFSFVYGLRSLPLGAMGWFVILAFASLVILACFLYLAVNVNPFKPNGIAYLYQLDQFFSYIGVVRCYFL